MFSTVSAVANAVVYDLSLGSVNDAGQYIDLQHGVALTVSSTDGPLHLATGLGVEQARSPFGDRDNVNFDNDNHEKRGVDNEDMRFLFDTEVILKGISFSGLTSNRESILLLAGAPTETFTASGNTYHALDDPRALTSFVLLTDGRGAGGGGAANVRVLSLDIDIPASMPVVVVPLPAASWFFLASVGTLLAARLKARAQRRSRLQ